MIRNELSTQFTILPQSALDPLGRIRRASIFSTQLVSNLRNTRKNLPRMLNLHIQRKMRRDTLILLDAAGDVQHDARRTPTPKIKLLGGAHA